MATGLAVPVRAFRGRAVIDEGDKEMGKLVLLAVSDRESTNPWNDDAGIRVPLFGLNNSATRALLSREIQGHFTRWEGEERAKLLGLGITGQAEELSARIEYRDIETDTAQDVVLNIRSG